MNREFILAVEELEKEKAISKDLLIEAIEMALISAYKKNYGTSQNVSVNIDRETGDIDVYMRKDVVETVEDESVQVAIEDVIPLDPNYKIGDAIEYRATPKDFGRIAAQTAKQVVVQRIREAERGVIFDDYVNRQGEIVTGTVQRVSNDTVFVSMGKTEGILAVTEQVKNENYHVNSRMKFYIMDVRKSLKGPQIYLSRSHPGLIKRLFELEVPEIQDGVVEIRSLAREAGSRTKMAVFTSDDGIDPVGACVGARGIRVQAVVDELSGEKIDIINWSEDAQQNISSALSPAKAERVIMNEDGKSATVIVPDYQLSLAIGKEGQNVRLAAKLCGFKIDIKSHSRYFPDQTAYEDEEYADEAADADAGADDFDADDFGADRPIVADEAEEPASDARASDTGDVAADVRADDETPPTREDAPPAVLDSEDAPPAAAETE
ncbi:MAG: transcription termination factor NusA [Clostridiales Family XIII bacterium]|jgi:N utilization substance protein A|nr:transcription termination factor NusA [Clostridiales Family XIII bacterium]